MDQHEIEDIYNFSFEDINLQSFKDELMRDFTWKQIETLVWLLWKYVQLKSKYYMHERIYKGFKDETFEENMIWIKILQDDLWKMIKKIWQK